MNVGWFAVEMGKPGSDQLLDGRDALGALDVTTAEIPVQPDFRPSVLADDPIPAAAGSDAPVSVKLGTGELPFQRPDPRNVPVGPAGRDWSAVVDAGRWPLVALAAAAVLVAVFAAFISRNGQSLSGDGESAEASAVSESASAPTVPTDRVDGTPPGAATGAGASAEAGRADGSTGRATGTLGAVEGSEFHSGQVVEPDRSLTGSDPDWAATTATTVARPTPAETSTSGQPGTTDPTPTSVTTPTTAQPPTTAETTSTSSTTEAPSEGPTVRAVGPGTGDAQNPIVVGSGRLTLEAEGSDESMRYRFLLYVRNDDGEWRRVERSRWRSRSTWTIDTERLEGRTVRWTVLGRTGFFNTTEESAPLYFRVGGESPDDD